MRDRLDPNITRLMPNRLTTRDQMAGYICDALAARQALIQCTVSAFLLHEERPTQKLGEERLALFLQSYTL